MYGISVALCILIIASSGLDSLCACLIEIIAAGARRSCPVFEVDNIRNFPTDELERVVVKRARVQVVAVASGNRVISLTIEYALAHYGTCTVDTR